MAATGDVGGGGGGGNRGHRASVRAWWRQVVRWGVDTTNIAW
jgi:hypothetical protein